jgi:hypothetical protein
MNQFMVTAIKMANFIPASTLNHRELVALLKEVECQFDEIIHHANVR